MHKAGAGSTIVRGAAIAGLLLTFAGIQVSGAVAQEEPEAVTIDLNEVENSGIFGTATLSPNDDLTDVSMMLEGEVEGNHPTHIHTGTCFNFDPNPLYPLETVLLSDVDDTGWSESTVEVSLTDLEGSDYVILVHFSPERLDDYLVCGEIPRSTMVTGGEDTASESEVPAETTSAPADAAHGSDHEQTTDDAVASASTDPTDEQLAAAHKTLEDAANASRTDAEGASAADAPEMTSLPSAGSGAGANVERASSAPLAIGLAGMAVVVLLVAIPVTRRGWR